MSTGTLETIVRHHHNRHLSMKQHEIGTLTQIAFRIQEELFISDRDRHLSSESKIFITCSNSTQHIINIVKKIFNEDPVPDAKAIAEELEVIEKERSNLCNSNLLEERLLALEEKLNEKSTSADFINLEDKLIRIEELLNSKSESNNSSNVGELLHMEERIKQSFFTRTCQIHSHLNHSDAGDKLSEMADLKIETDRVLSDKLAKLERTQDFLRDEFSRLTTSLIEHQKASSIIMENSVARVAGAMIPPMLVDAFAEHLEPVKTSMLSIKNDTTSLKKNKHREAGAARTGGF